MKRNMKYLAAFAAILLATVVILAGCSVFPGSTNNPSITGPNNTAPGFGRGGMMGPGMGGRWGYPYSGEDAVTIDQAAEAVEEYIATYGNDLELVEIMEFDRNFYAEIEEKSTGIHAMELLVDKDIARVYPEMGPNMMWNTKYGMHSYRPGENISNNLTVSAENAQQLAQKYLDRYMPGLTVGEAETFYGYYTMHTLDSGEIEGMLSVNGYNGAVWYHNWHGLFVGMKEFHDETEN